MELLTCPPSQFLTEEEREQIRLEEKLRHDIRMRQRSRIWWINTPIVIWLLSAVVAGLIPFSYLEYQKRVEIEREERQIRREAAASVLSEIEFRIAQFNEVLDRTKKTRQEAALIAEANLMDVISNNRLSETGTKLQALFSSAPPLRVTSELGGIYAIPRTDEDMRMCGSGDLGGTTLTFRMGEVIGTRNISMIHFFRFGRSIHP